MKKSLMYIATIFLVASSISIYADDINEEVDGPGGGGTTHVCCALISTSKCVTVSVTVPGGDGTVKHYEFSGMKFNCPN